MNTNISKQYLLPGFLLLVIVVLVLRQLPDGPSNLTELRSEEDFLKIDPECVDTPEFYGGVKSKVCILPGETYSESQLRANGVFDGATINILVKAMTVYPEATFLDCGANIGMVTTVIAAMGRKVVSIDPLKEHLSYVRKSLELLGNQDNVRLIHGAVSNESSVLFPYAENIANKAAIQMFTEEEMKKNNYKPTGPAVNVVTVLDLLSIIKTKTVILKVDVEAFECRAVSREVASGKSGHQIPFIIMEWTLLQEMPEYTACVDWLLEGGYTPHGPDAPYPVYTREEVKELRPWYAGAPGVHDLIWLHSTADPALLAP